MGANAIVFTPEGRTLERLARMPRFSLSLFALLLMMGKAHAQDEQTIKLDINYHSPTLVRFIGYDPFIDTPKEKREYGALPKGISRIYSGTGNPMAYESPSRGNPKLTATGTPDGLRRLRERIKKYESLSSDQSIVLVKIVRVSVSPDNTKQVSIPRSYVYPPTGFCRPAKIWFGSKSVVSNLPDLTVRTHTNQDKTMSIMVWGSLPVNDLDTLSEQKD